LSELWPGDGHVPWYLQFVIDTVKMMGSKPVSGSLRMAWAESRELKFALGEESL
jgi:hypothetical protein